MLTRACVNLFLGIFLMLAAGAATADRASEAQAQLKQVQQRISALKSKIDRDQRRRGDLSKALTSTEREIAEIGARLHKSRKAIARHEQRIRALDSQRGREEEALKTRLDQLGSQIRSAYQNGQQGKLRLLFSQNDPAALGRMLKYHDYYAKAQSAAIGEVREDLAKLRATRTELASVRDALETQRQTQARLLTGLRETQREREQALTAVERALQSGGQKLVTLQEDETQLRELMGSLRQKLADIPIDASGKPFANYKGKLTPPVSGRTIAAFGQKKAGGPLRWQGVWLGAKAGSPVKTAAAGRVVYVGQMHRYGLIVVLDHGDDFYTVYGHAQAAYVEVGQWVRPGETIAAAGNSGGHKSNGVYFEIRRGRKPVNPSRWLRS